MVLQPEEDDGHVPALIPAGNVPISGNMDSSRRGHGLRVLTAAPGPGADEPELTEEETQLLTQVQLHVTADILSDMSALFTFYNDAYHTLATVEMQGDTVEMTCAMALRAWPVFLGQLLGPEHMHNWLSYMRRSHAHGRIDPELWMAVCQMAMNFPPDVTAVSVRGATLSHHASLRV